MPIWSASDSPVRLFGSWIATTEASCAPVRASAPYSSRATATAATCVAICEVMAIDMRSRVWSASACAISWPITCAISSSVAFSWSHMPV
ncbi:hypothetical protein D3C83_84940 [compost metagenome]